MPRIVGTAPSYRFAVTCRPADPTSTLVLRSTSDPSVSGAIPPRGNLGAFSMQPQLLATYDVIYSYDSFGARRRVNVGRVRLGPVRRGGLVRGSAVNFTVNLCGLRFPVTASHSPTPALSSRFGLQGIGIYVSAQAELGTLQRWLHSLVTSMPKQTLRNRQLQTSAENALVAVEWLGQQPTDLQRISRANSRITILRLSLVSNGRHREADFLNRFWRPLYARLNRERTAHQAATAVSASRFGLRGIGGYVSE